MADGTESTVEEAVFFFVVSSTDAEAEATDAVSVLFSAGGVIEDPVVTESLLSTFPEDGIPSR